MRRRSSVGTNLLTLREANRSNNGSDGDANGANAASNGTENATTSAVQPKLNGGLQSSSSQYLDRINENGNGLLFNDGDDDEDEQSAPNNEIVATNGIPNGTTNGGIDDGIANNTATHPNEFTSSSSSSFGGYLIAVHRKLTRQDTYFLSYHKTRTILFGVPLLIPCYEGGSNKDLYCAVWAQVARLLSPLPSTPPDQSNHATDW